MQPKNELDRGPLTLTPAMALLRPSPAYPGHGRVMVGGGEIRALQLALEAKLQESEGWARCVETLIHNLEQGIVIADGKGFVTSLNQQGEHMIGLPRARMVGQSLNQVWREAGLPPLPWSSCAHGGRLLDGQEILLTDDNLFAGGVIRILSDVTRRVRMEEQFKIRQRAAAVGEMVGRVAHEIRNPLASIELFASLLGATTHNEVERHRLSEQISMVVRTLDQLLSNILVISGPPKFRIQSVLVEKLIRETLVMAMPPIRKKKIVIQEYLESETLTIEADELMMRQSLLNILLNAIQASPEGGTIEIVSRAIQTDPRHHTKDQSAGSREGQPFLVISVRDFGGGIAPEDQPRLFDPFFSKRKGGTGLGLAIVRQVMDIHGGWIHCESQVGKGTTFQLYYPQGRKGA